MFIPNIGCDNDEGICVGGDVFPFVALFKYKTFI